MSYCPDCRCTSFREINGDVVCIHCGLCQQDSVLTSGFDDLQRCSMEAPNNSEKRPRYCKLSYYKPAVRDIKLKNMRSFFDNLLDNPLYEYFKSHKENAIFIANAYLEQPGVPKIPADKNAVFAFACLFWATRGSREIGRTEESMAHELEWTGYGTVSDKKLFTDTCKNIKSFLTSVGFEDRYEYAHYFIDLLPGIFIRTALNEMFGKDVHLQAIKRSVMKEASSMLEAMEKVPVMRNKMRNEGAMKTGCGIILCVIKDKRPCCAPCKEAIRILAFWVRVEQTTLNSYGTLLRKIRENKTSN